MRGFLQCVRLLTAAAAAAAACFWSSTFPKCLARAATPGGANEPALIPTSNEYEYLTRYGYIKASRQLGELHSPQAVRQSIRQFQLMTRLEPSGFLDAATRHKMRQPRCGMPDVISQESLEDADEDRPASYVLPGSRWNKRILTWRITKYSDDLSQALQRRAIEKAFNVWLAVTDLDIRETTEFAPDIDVQFTPAQHGDRYPFDGTGGVLAHAFYPPSGAVHFDDDEEWTYRGDAGVNVERVAAHEFGHTLGLGHSGVPGALMSPYYSFHGETYSLSDDDVLGIRALYGVKGSSLAELSTESPTKVHDHYTSPAPSPSSATATTTKERINGLQPAVTADKDGSAKHPDYCKTRLDDITQWTDGRTYAFKDEWVYRFRESDQGLDAGYPKRSSLLFYRFPPKPDAVIYSWRTRMLYAFKDRYLWKYSGYRLQEGYPMRVGGFFPKIRAGLLLPDGNMLLVSDRSIFKWDETHDALISLSDNRGWSVYNYWRGAPSSMDAAYYDIHTRATVIFKGQTYYRYPDELQGGIAPGYPRLSRKDWMGC